MRIFSLFQTPTVILSRKESFPSGECFVHFRSFLSKAAHALPQLFTASATPLLASAFSEAVCVPASVILSSLSESSGLWMLSSCVWMSPTTSSASFMVLIVL